MFNPHPRWTSDCEVIVGMKDKVALSDQFEERLIEFAAHVIQLAGRIAKNLQGRHVAKQILRSGTAGAPNYAEARAAESRADFIHKMSIVQKELNETAVWIRIIAKSSLISQELLIDILAENKELCRIASASIRTARVRAIASASNENSRGKQEPSLR
jgi:four helix bundle protein